MGEIDLHVKNFIKLDSVFAQLFSQGVYGGEMRIDPGKLKEFDTVYQDTLGAGDGKGRGVERLRDAEKIGMVFDEKTVFQVIMGIEGQAGNHYYMPVRCMELDALTYSYQCRKIAQKAKEGGELRRYADGVPKGTKILPSVTLVFYTGKEPWDGPRSVYDMLDLPEEEKERMRRVAPDYRMNLIDARHLSDEEIDRYEGDLRAFLLMLGERFDREKLKTAVAMHRETWYALSRIKHDRRYAEFIDRVSDDHMAGGIDMDAALEYLVAEGEVRGEEKVSQLGLLMSKAGRAEDFLRSLSDRKLRKSLLLEFGLEEKKQRDPGF